MRKITAFCLVCDKRIKGFVNGDKIDVFNSNSVLGGVRFAKYVHLIDGRIGYLHLKCHYDESNIDFKKVNPNDVTLDNLNTLVIKALSIISKEPILFRDINDGESINNLQKLIASEMSFTIRYHRNGTFTVTTRDEFPYGCGNTLGEALGRFILLHAKCKVA